MTEERGKLTSHICNHLRLVLVLVFIVGTATCGRGGPGKTKILQSIKDSGELVVLTTNQPITYYLDRDDIPTGPEFDFVSAFARYLGVTPKFEVLDSVDQVFSALREGRGHFAAASLTITDERKTEFDFGAPYLSVNEYLVCHRNIPRVKNKEQLAQLEIVVPASTSYVDTLANNYPEVKIEQDDYHATEVLLNKVRDKHIQCTVADSTIFNISRRTYPEISNKYTLSKGSQLAWMYHKNNENLTQEIEEWFKEFKSSGEYSQILEKYFGHVETFDYVDIQKFNRRINDRLPKYRDWFVEAASQNGLSPSMLAAQSYQESHWNPRAKSPTGVRGIMMLTLPVAKSLGVTSRLDPEQNIFAGAQHQAKLKAVFAEEVPEPDRTWLALAAYNIGLGHFRDAQSLAKKMGKNPNVWVDMKEVLPLLADKKYYKSLRYGYARGYEPVQYVTRIRDYNAILAQNFEMISQQ